MYLEKLKELYDRNHLPESEYEFAEKLILEMWDDLRSFSIDELDQIMEENLDHFILILKDSNRATIPAFVVLMRYFKVNKMHPLYIQLTKYTGILDVVENIQKRLERLHGKAALLQMMDGIEVPVLGWHPKAIPAFTQEFVSRLEKKFTQEEVEEILTGNNHGVPDEAMIPEKIEYENANSLEQYLLERHERKVKELQEYCDQQKIWFEQYITQEVVDYVKSNQEILSAVLKDNHLFITKIPYDTAAFLHAEDRVEKRYYACHCGFAREAIKQKNQNISKNWCYCSAGFAKHPFEVILSQKLPIKCLKSALENDLICRFSIDLTGIEYKK